MTELQWIQESQSPKLRKTQSAPFTPQEPLTYTRVIELYKGSSWLQISLLLLISTDTTHDYPTN